ncbi:unnamed protein product [Mycena citricolor]|uniref:Uncharacterized protein n=1 Tax=Mycena citricolor TaxID=2018698 RepID=A0AAD2H0K2_9AGAR|nr:unnamed protein product [Mycena citricolor]
MGYMTSSIRIIDLALTERDSVFSNRHKPS